MKPITFAPLYKERIWGGRKLENIYQRQLPHPTNVFGEAWEIVDREEEQSIVASGDFAKKSLHDLWTKHRSEVFGDCLPDASRFPILIKILDSAADLSIQVHPPASIASSLNGEPKTEMWYIAAAKPGAKLYAGLAPDVTRNSFEKAIASGEVASQVHSIQAELGQSIFIPSGRLHAIGAGFLIHEIQQNSDTTYRVFDWNRTDSSGKPRDLHVEESLACIDFSDFVPTMDRPDGDTLAKCPYFHTTRHHLEVGEKISTVVPDKFSLITIITGQLGMEHPTGQTILLPPGTCSPAATLPSTLLRISIPD